MKCEETCLGFKAIGQDACLGCAGQVVSLELRPVVKPAEKPVLKPIPVLRLDGRCKHGMFPNTCSYCEGIPMSKEREYGRKLSYIGNLELAFRELIYITNEED